MKRLILARHGESEYSLHGRLNGYPAVDVGLTERGEEEARRLGSALAGEPVDLAVHTGFPRTTLELALTGRLVPVIVEPRLGDPRAGSFEGSTLDDYCPGPGTRARVSRLPGAARAVSRSLGGTRPRFAG
jgi:broad specificity phosphatase PhoE